MGFVLPQVAVHNDSWLGAAEAASRASARRHVVNRVYVMMLAHLLLWFQVLLNQAAVLKRAVCTSWVRLRLFVFFLIV